MRVGAIENSNGLGCEVTGLDLADLDRPSVHRELNDLWLDRGLLVFRGIEGEEAQIKLSRIFGEIKVHPVGKLLRGDKHPELTRVWSDPEDPDLSVIGGRERSGWLPWHSDWIYFREINRGGLLRPLHLPSAGGETGFLDKIALYDALDDELKDQIEDLSVVYVADVNYERQIYGRLASMKRVKVSKNIADIESRQDNFPPVVHPLVFQQPGTGRKVLNFSPWFAKRVINYHEEEGGKILHRLAEYVSDERAYFHRWAEGDMVLWDNWRMLHRALGVEPHELRVMERTNIIGDYGLGRFERDSVVTQTSTSFTV